VKYAVKVPIGDFSDDDWLFVTKEGPDGPEIVLYETKEAAQTQAQIWDGKGVVVEYDDK
jgi:hypothetical protein